MKEYIIGLLHTGGYSCVIMNGEELRTFKRRGVADLYDLLRNDASFLHEAMIADKVIGKAAAALIVLGGMKEVYADIISRSALALLEEAGVKAGALQIVDHISNRNQTAWCPLETICCQAKSATEILPLIQEFIEKNQNRNQ